MKTEIFLKKSILAVAFAVFLLTGCKPKDEDKVTPDTKEETTKQTTNANDQTNIDQQTNESVDDAIMPPICRTVLQRS